MALKLENINNLISDDLASRNENWTEIDNTFELKADKSTTYTKTEVDTSLDLKANKQQEEWITPTLLNGWVEYDSIRGPKYMIDNLGFVHLKGAIKGGSIGTPVFTLPVGFRPNSPLYFPVVSNFLFGSVGINSVGTLTPVAGNNASLYLNGITFREEQ